MNEVKINHERSKKQLYWTIEGRLRELSRILGVLGRRRQFSLELVEDPFDGVIPDDFGELGVVIEAVPRSDDLEKEILDKGPQNNEMGEFQLIAVTGPPNPQPNPQPNSVCDNTIICGLCEERDDPDDHNRDSHPDGE